MKGSIRFFIGFLLMLGSVGTMEIDPTASILVQTIIVIAGIAFMLSGVRSINTEN